MKNHQESMTEKIKKNVKHGQGSRNWFEIKHPPQQPPAATDLTYISLQDPATACFRRTFWCQHRPAKRQNLGLAGWTRWKPHDEKGTETWICLVEYDVIFKGLYICHMPYLHGPKIWYTAPPFLVPEIFRTCEFLCQDVEKSWVKQNHTSPWSNPLTSAFANFD